MGNIISEVIIYTAMLSFLVYIAEHTKNQNTRKRKRNNREKGVF